MREAALSLPTILVRPAASPLVRMTTWQVTPVQKVIQLLAGMLEKGKKEKQEEQVRADNSERTSVDR